MAVISERQRSVSARRLMQARRDRGLTQVEAAILCGDVAGVRSFSRWESEDGPEPNPKALRKLAEVYGKEIWWLRATDVEEGEWQKQSIR